LSLYGYDVLVGRLVLGGRVSATSDSSDEALKTSKLNSSGAAKSVLWGWRVDLAYVFLKNLTVKNGLTKSLISIFWPRMTASA
jgi:hypothetical protein